MSLGGIIRKKREEMNLTLDEVSSRVGFSKPYLSTIETGKAQNPPSDELLRKLEQVLEFEPGLLLHIAHMQRVPTDIRQQFEATTAENKKFKHLLKNLLDQRIDVKKLNKLLPKRKLSTRNIESPLPASQLVPIINRVSAGYPSDFNDLDYPVGVADDYVRCPDLHDPNAFAVRVVGDSMEPKFKQGDIVIFSPAADVRSGDDCFIRFASPHQTTFKRAFFESDGKIRLQPRNENYPPQIEKPKKINGIYRAIMKYEKL